MTDSQQLEFDVIVLGGGFAGVYTSQALGRALGPDASRRVALIAEENYMVFQPMLAEVAGASISPRHVANPLRMLCRHVDILKGTVESIDWDHRCLKLAAGPMAGIVTVRFKHLVMSVGAVIDLSRIPGMPEHAFLMQNVGDALLLRSTIVGRLEEANIERRPDVRQRLLTFVVVGGGYSGVETAGQILDLLRGIHRYYPGISPNDLRVVLVHSGDRLLQILPAKLGDYCSNLMRKRGLDLRLGCRVSSVTATQVILSDGTVIPTTTVVSTVGNAPSPLVLDLIDQANLESQRGRIITTETMAVPGQDGLWAAGDCAAVPFVKGGWCPQTAQFAYRQGQLLGKNIAAALRGQPGKPFRFKGLGELASIGHRAAVAHVFGFNFSGFFAWWMWRTIYLMKLPRLDRKLHVLIDWTLDLFFPRDINMISPRYSQQLKEMHLEPGNILFNSGEPAYSLYVVRSGRIDLSDDEGIVSSHLPGDYFGERALLGDRTWRFTAKAGETTKLVAIPATVFRQIIGSGGSLGRLFKKSSIRYQSREVIDSTAGRLPAEILDAPVSTIMQTNLVTCGPEQSMAKTLSLLRNQPHSSYPVIGDGGEFVGLMRRDDFYDCLKRPETSQASPVSLVGFIQIPAVHRETPVKEVVERLIRSGANKIAVIDSDHRLCGIVTVLDLVTAATGESLSESSAGDSLDR